MMMLKPVGSSPEETADFFGMAQHWIVASLHFHATWHAVVRVLLAVIKLLAQDVHDTYAPSPHHVGHGNVDVMRYLPCPGSTAHLPEDLGNLA